MERSSSVNIKTEVKEMVRSSLVNIEVKEMVRSSLVNIEVEVKELERLSLVSI